MSGIAKLNHHFSKNKVIGLEAMIGELKAENEVKIF